MASIVLPKISSLFDLNIIEINNISDIITIKLKTNIEIIFLIFVFILSTPYKKISIPKHSQTIKVANKFVNTITK